MQSMQPKPSTSKSDRLTQWLGWVAIILIAALAALGADLALVPARSMPAAQAIAAPPGDFAASVPEPSLAPTATLALATDFLTATSNVTPTVTLDPPATYQPQSAITPPPCVPPDDWGIHIVQEGNTLYSLAERYGTDVDTLMLVNCLNTYTIFVDQRLYVPGLAAPTAVPTVLPTFTLAPTFTPRPGASATPGIAVAATPTQPAAPKGQTLLRLNIPDRYLNIVLLGSDKRPNSGAWRTDSMIVVSVDLQTNTVRLLSLPRDLWVTIPAHGDNRINTADLWGELAKKGSGPDRVKQTIYYNLGIPVHYYVRVDFQGFMKIIDTVGGVDVDVDCPLPDINLSAGVQHLDARQALRYARSRKSTNDFDRGRRQRKVLLALWDQALSLDIIPKLPVLWKTMADSFQTDLPLDQVINLAYVGAQLKPQRILSTAIGPKQVQSWITPQGAAVLLPRQDRIKALLESFYTPKDPNNLDAVEKVRIRVLNGAQRGQAAQLAAAALGWEGYKVVDALPADNREIVQTQILVFNGDLATGTKIAELLGVPPGSVQDAAAMQQPDPAKPVDLQIILGQDYDPCQRY